MFRPMCLELRGQEDVLHSVRYGLLMKLTVLSLDHKFFAPIIDRVFPMQRGLDCPISISGFVSPLTVLPLAEIFDLMVIKNKPLQISLYFLKILMLFGSTKLGSQKKR